MDEARIRAICLASSTRCTVTFVQRKPSETLPAGPDILIKREGEPVALSAEGWMHVRDDVESEMRRQGYDLVGWLSMSNEHQHGLAYVPSGSIDPWYLRKLW